MSASSQMNITAAGDFFAPVFFSMSTSGTSTVLVDGAASTLIVGQMLVGAGSASATLTLSNSPPKPPRSAGFFG